MLAPTHHDICRLVSVGPAPAYWQQEIAKGSGPHVEEGSPAQNASKIQGPVLIFHGERDFNVPIEQARLMADRLKDAGKKAELVVYRTSIII